MVLQIYTIYDKKTKIYHCPLYCHNDAHAARVFSGVFRKADSQFAGWPQDFSVCKVGSFDDASGMLTASNCEHVFEATALVDEEV